jgi:hypothetical protein
MYGSEISLTILLMLGLATFRITRLIVYDKITEPLRRPFFTEVEEVNDDGSIDIYIRPKDKGIRRWVGELFSCHWCTGIWVSIGVATLYMFHWPLGEWTLLLFSVAAIGSIVEVIISKLVGE